MEVVGLAWAWALGGNPEPHSRARKPEIWYSFWWCNYDFLEADETDRNRSSLPISVVVSHRNRFRAEYSGRNLAEYSAETVSVKIMGFGDERNIR